ncbi:T9SS type B sorting domain-containing protein [Taibaiella helva]|uniref:T9SS type B sorting domain-containing protein n=1 Tax=Taibaiella helva TaxID=2301235 RepID=UPI000E596CC4|nr:gliding motility-associated C-terminal domain-containing protein [Taibaiella helva]
MSKSFLNAWVWAAILVFSFGTTRAQLLPPNQPEQDACGALQLCGNSFFTPYSYQGIGVVSDLSSSPCGAGTFNPCGEDNVVWLKLVVSAPGTIVFTITPVATADDYDFAIANITNGNCNNITQAQVIRCNFNNNAPVFNGGVVGLNSTSTLTQVAGGTTGSSFLQQITAAAGDVYLIMINNFGAGGGPSSGFTIDFTGSTATFFDNTPPHFSNLQPASPCTYKNKVTVHLNTQIACNSIAANGSDFQLSPAGVIASASGINCSGTNGYTQDVVVNFAPALAPGTYTLRAKTGTDNNTLLNLCNTALTLPDSITFTVPPAAQYSNTSLACTTLTVQTNVPIKCASVSANGSDFGISGPAPAAITSATAVGCVNGYTSTITLQLAGPITASGVYALTAQNGSDGNTLEDSCGTFQAVGNSISFNAKAQPRLQLSDTLVTCSNTGVVLPLVITNNDPALNYTYQWAPAAGLSDPAIAQPLANPAGDARYVVTVGSNDPSMCTAKDSVFVHNLMGFSILNNDTTICEGASVSINVAGSDEYTYVWTSTTGVSDPNIKNPVLTPATSTTYTLVASHAGCNDSADIIVIDVQPNPTNIKLQAERTEMCRGESISLHALAEPLSFNFSYSWTPAGDLMYSSGPNNVYTGDTSVYVSVTASTPIGCSAKDSVKLTVFPGDFAALNTTDTGYCPGGQVQLQAEGGVSYSWDPAYGLSATDIVNPVASPQTSTQYRMIAKDIHGCTDTQFVQVSVYPEAILGIPDSISIYPGESYTIDPVTNCHYFTWFPPSGLSATNVANPVAQPEVRTRYFVNAVTERGCTLRDSIDVLVKETVIDMPNAFHPGGSNGVFKPAKRGIARLKSFNIYNRWGQKVFESSNIDKGWDGSYNDKPQPMGVYIYTIEAVTDSGKPFTREGNVTLIR